MDILNMAHLGSRAFDEIGGEVVQTTSFAIRKSHTKKYKGTYCRLIDPTSQQGKENVFLDADDRYYSEQNKFFDIPGKPVAYWASNNMLNIFNISQPLKNVAEPKVGLQTAKNDIFLRRWYECEWQKIGIGYSHLEDTENGKHKWFPYNKGGAFRRWYGNREYVINWEKNGSKIKNNPGAVIRNPQCYFLPCITWSDITTTSFSGRYCEGGFLFDVKGSSGFPKFDNLLYILGLLNSKISQTYIQLLNPTITTQVGDMARIPMLFSEVYKPCVDRFVESCIEISKFDWDSFETSWDFKKHPLLCYNFNTVSEAFQKWLKPFRANENK